MNDQMKQALLTDLGSVSGLLNRIHVMGRTEMQYLLGSLEVLDSIATRIASLPESEDPTVQEVK